jgi:hypothetical protein
VDAIGSILLALVLLKLAIIANGIAWFAKNGERFGEVIERRQPRDVFQMLALTPSAELPGARLHFRDYRRLLALLRRHGRLGILAAESVRIAFSSRGIVALGLLYGVSATWHGRTGPPGSVSISTDAWLAYAVLVVLLACGAGLVVESIYANALFGGYGRRFRFARAGHTRGSGVLAELWTLLACAGKIGVAAIGAAFVAGSSMGAFRGFATARPGVGSALGRLLDAVYFVTTTFATVGYGDIVPVTAAGKVLTVGIVTSAFLLVVVALFIASVTSALSRR